jgi:hypothetical protein
LKGKYMIKQANVESPLAAERLCVLRFRDGRKMELRGKDVPSVGALLVFFKRRKLRRSQERSRPGALKLRMLHDLKQRRLAQLQQA